MLNVSHLGNSDTTYNTINTNVTLIVFLRNNNNTINIINKDNTGLH